MTSPVAPGNAIERILGNPHNSLTPHGKKTARRAQRRCPERERMMLYNTHKKSHARLGMIIGVGLLLLMLTVGARDRGHTRQRR